MEAKNIKLRKNESNGVTQDYPRFQDCGYHIKTKNPSSDFKVAAGPVINCDIECKQKYSYHYCFVAVPHQQQRERQEKTTRRLICLPQSFLLGLVPAFPQISITVYH